MTEAGFWFTALLRAGFIVALINVSGCKQAAEPVPDPREISWEDLVPEGDPFPPEQFQPDPHSTKLEQLSGSIVPELNGQRVKIAAFIVPLEWNSDSLNELLLVPYFGACIHIPPPPSNQIIYFESDEKSVEVKDFDLKMPVWATGTLFTDETDHDLAQVGYRIDIESLDKFEGKY